MKHKTIFLYLFYFFVFIGGTCFAYIDANKTFDVAGYLGTLVVMGFIYVFIFLIILIISR